MSASERDREKQAEFQRFYLRLLAEAFKQFVTTYLTIG